MKVYIVFHADIEDDRYVRAVCDTEQKAEQIANSPQVIDLGGGKTRIHDHFTRGGTQPSLCCYVDEWEVQ